MSELIWFWIGYVAGCATVYYGTHPEQRDALFSRIKALFAKKEDAP